MKVYIAGPMSGLPEFNYPAFRAAGDVMADRGYGVLNPVDAERHNDTGKPQTWDWYMRHALGMVIAADGIALLPGWEESRGAALEVTVGRALNLDIRPIEEWGQLA